MSRKSLLIIVVLLLIGLSTPSRSIAQTSVSTTPGQVVYLHVFEDPANLNRLTLTFAIEGVESNCAGAPNQFFVDLRTVTGQRLYELLLSAFENEYLVAVVDYRCVTRATGQVVPITRDIDVRRGFFRSR